MQYKYLWGAAETGSAMESLSRMDSTDLRAVNLQKKQTWRREDPEQKSETTKNTLESEMMRGKCEYDILVPSNSNGTLEISIFEGEKIWIRKTETNAQIVQKKSSLVPATIYTT